MQFAILSRWVDAIVQLEQLGDTKFRSITMAQYTDFKQALNDYEWFCLHNKKKEYILLKFTETLNDEISI